MRTSTAKGYSIYLDDVDIIDLGFHMEPGHEHPALVAGRDYKQSIPGRPGVIRYSDDPGPIPFSIPIFTLTKDPFELQQQVRLLKSIFKDHDGRKKVVKLRFSYEPDIYYHVTYDGQVGIERIFSRIGKAILPLICDDGYGLSVAKNDEITWGSNVIPFWSDYTLGHTGDGSVEVTSSISSTVIVTGANQKPVIRINGTGEDVEIGWGGKSFTLGTFTNAEWLIDLGNYEVSKDGLNAMDLIGGDWLSMHFNHGENDINISGTGLNLTFSADFRDRYF